MRQTGQRIVAPMNTEPNWPDGYIEVLREMGAVEKTIPYCVSWVQSFFARFPGRPRRDLGRVEIEQFLRERSQCRSVSNWQLSQARAAIEVYYEQFRGIALAPRPDRMDSGNSGEKTPHGTMASPTEPPPSPDASDCTRDPAFQVLASGSSYPTAETGFKDKPREMDAPQRPRPERPSASLGEQSVARPAVGRDARMPPAHDRTDWPLLEAKMRG